MKTRSQQKATNKAVGAIGQPRVSPDHWNRVIVGEDRVELARRAGAARGIERAVEAVRDEHVVELRALLEGEALAVHLRPHLRDARALRLVHDDQEHAAGPARRHPEPAEQRARDGLGGRLLADAHPVDGEGGVVQPEAQRLLRLEEDAQQHLHRLRRHLGRVERALRVEPLGERSEERRGARLLERADSQRLEVEEAEAAVGLVHRRRLGQRLEQPVGELRRGELHPLRLLRLVLLEERHVLEVAQRSLAAREDAPLEDVAGAVPAPHRALQKLGALLLLLLGLGLG
mmetsp:Transcript_35897/g.118191  ORF Transcript_35897/g.118191 Transcript_35897/m.118191 type:complete len:288 (+) Transcript_35897:36-899(+)